VKKERFRPLVAVVLLLIQKGQVLLMKRANSGFGDGLYALPGGGMDGDEPLRNALIREAKEELGIDISPADLEFVTVLHTGRYEKNKYEALVFCFKTDKFSGKLVNNEPHKCDDLRFFPLDALPENMLDSSIEALQNLNKNIPFQELHW
jgi:8-oxo-dGTP diphosphatase